MLRSLPVLLVLSAADVCVAQPFDPMPLLNSAALDTGAVERERQAFLRWAQDRKSLGPDEAAAARERLYFLIGSAVKQNLFAQHGHRPRFDLADLAQLFEHAASLGVHGASQVARAFPLRSSDVIGGAPPVPAPFRVEFAAPLLQISSSEGAWIAEVPYYFMVGDLQRFQANNGLQTEVLSVSTLFSANENRPGVSQATILQVFSPTTNVHEFNEYWREQLGLAARDSVPESLREGATTYRARDEAQDMNKEVVFLRTARGPMVVAYFGLTGPYASNRVNFLDYLQRLRVP